MRLHNKIAVVIAATLVLNAATPTVALAQTKSDDVLVLPDWWLEVFCEEGGPTIGAEFHVCTLPGGRIVLCIPGDGGDWYCLIPAPEQDDRPWVTEPKTGADLSDDRPSPILTSAGRSEPLSLSSPG